MDQVSWRSPSGAAPNVRIFIYFLNLVGFYACTESGLGRLLYEIRKACWVWIEWRSVAWSCTKGTWRLVEKPDDVDGIPSPAEAPWKSELGPSWALKHRTPHTWSLGKLGLGEGLPGIRGALSGGPQFTGVLTECPEGIPQHCCCSPRAHATHAGSLGGGHLEKSPASLQHPP